MSPMWPELEVNHTLQGPEKAMLLLVGSLAAENSLSFIFVFFVVSTNVITY